MATEQQKQTMTAEDLLNLPDDGWRYELVQGELRRMPPAGIQHGQTASRLDRRLAAHVEAKNLGVVCTAEAGFKLAEHSIRMSSVLQMCRLLLANALRQKECRPATGPERQILRLRSSRQTTASMMSLRKSLDILQLERGSFGLHIHGRGP